MSYIDRLRYLKLPTLAYRRVRGDMIEVYKLLTLGYDENIKPNLGMSRNTRTRGNVLKLETVRAN